MHKLQNLMEGCRGALVRWSKLLVVEREKELKEKTEALK